MRGIKGIRDKDERGFSVYGTIRGQSRPRATTRCGHASVYKAPADVRWEKLISDAYTAAWGGLDPISGSFGVDIVVNVQIPKSATKAQRASMMGAPCTCKPDLDNVIKSVLDALNPHESDGFTGAYDDDKNCIAISAQKYYSSEARLDVVVYSIEEDE